MDEITKSQDTSEESSIYTFTRMPGGEYSIEARVTPPKITQLVIPEEYNGGEVTRIKFFGFPDLKELTLSSSVREIDDDAFEDCEKLKTVHFTGSKEDWIRIKDAFPSDVKVLITEAFVNSAIAEEEEEEEEEDFFADAYVTSPAASEPEEEEEDKPEPPKKESTPYRPAAPKKKKRSLFGLFFALLPLVLGFIIGGFAFGNNGLQNGTVSTLTAIATYIAAGIRLIITLVAAKKSKFRPKMKKAVPLFFKNLFFVGATFLGFLFFLSIIGI